MNLFILNELFCMAADDLLEEEWHTSNAYNSWPEAASSRRIYMGHSMRIFTLQRNMYEARSIMDRIKSSSFK